MKKWNMIVDVEKCQDCNNCFLSCKDEFTGNDFTQYSAEQPKHGHRWMNIFRRERGTYPMVDMAYLPVPCMHCDDAHCMKAAKNGAVTKRSDGIVLIDPEKAKGQKNIAESCPYNTIWWNEEKEIPQKCTFCAHLLDNDWKAPRCIQGCATGALVTLKVDDSEMRKIVRDENLEILHPEYKTNPRVYYKNLYRYSRCFIGGSVAVDENGAIDCLKGSKVKLYKNANLVEETVTDAYGDFVFDDLGKNSGTYSIEITHDAKKMKHLEVELGSSLYVGEILL